VLGPYNRYLVRARPAARASGRDVVADLVGVGHPSQVLALGRRAAGPAYGRQPCARPGSASSSWRTHRKTAAARSCASSARPELPDHQFAVAERRSAHHVHASRPTTAPPSANPELATARAAARRTQALTTIGRTYCHQPSQAIHRSLGRCYGLALLKLRTAFLPTDPRCSPGPAGHVSSVEYRRRRHQDSLVEPGRGLSPIDYETVRSSALAADLELTAEEVATFDGRSRGRTPRPGVCGRRCRVGPEVTETTSCGPYRRGQHER